MRYCEYCGAERSDMAKFCPKCGKPVECDANKPSQFSSPKTKQIESGFIWTEIPMQSEANVKNINVLKSVEPFQEDGGGNHGISNKSDIAFESKDTTHSNSQRNKKNIKVAVIVAGFILVVAIGWLVLREYDPRFGLPNKPSPDLATNNVSKNSASSTIGESMDPRWFKSQPNGYLIWNPQPQSGETAEWSGRRIEDPIVKGRYFAAGYGLVVWLINGEFVQSDEGWHTMGKRNGIIIQRFKDGRVETSKWENGQKVGPK